MRSIEATAPDADAGEAVSFTARDGRTLYGLLILAPSDAAARGAVVVNGATGFPREFYLKFAQYCAERGFHALVYDYRGMGASALVDPASESVRMSDWGRFDMPAALAFLDRRFPQLPIVTIGHSVGGQFVGFLPNHARACGHLLVSTSVGYWRGERFPFRYAALFLWLIYGPLMLRVRGCVPQGGPWRGQSLPPGVFREWRRWCLQPTHFGPDLDGELRENWFREIREPICLFGFTDDPIATPLTVPTLLEFFANAPREVRWIDPKARGLGHVGHHGFFSSRFRDSLWPEAVDWVAARASAIATSTSAPPTN